MHSYTEQGQGYSRTRTTNVKGLLTATICVVLVVVVALAVGLNSVFQAPVQVGIEAGAPVESIQTGVQVSLRDAFIYNVGAATVITVVIGIVVMAFMKNASISSRLIAGGLIGSVTGILSVIFLQPVIQVGIGILGVPVYQEQVNNAIGPSPLGRIAAIGLAILTFGGIAWGMMSSSSESDQKPSPDPDSMNLF